MDALCSTEKLTGWRNKVILNASSHTHYNCILVYSPGPNQITKLKLPSTSYSLDLGAYKTASKCFLMSETIQYFLCILKHLKDEVKLKSLVIGMLSKIFLYQVMS